MWVRDLGGLIMENKIFFYRFGKFGPKNQNCLLSMKYKPYFL